MSCLRDGRHIDLKQVTKENDLGVIMDQEPKFYHQTASAVKKATRMLAIIKNSFSVLNIFILPPLSKALVGPLLEYGNVIWGRHYKLYQQAMEKVQKRPNNINSSIERLRLCAPPESIESFINSV